MENYTVFYRYYDGSSGIVATKEIDLKRTALITDNNGSIEFVDADGKLMAGFNHDIWTHYYTYEDWE